MPDPSYVKAVTQSHEGYTVFSGPFDRDLTRFIPIDLSEPGVAIEHDDATTVTHHARMLIHGQPAVEDTVYVISEHSNPVRIVTREISPYELVSHQASLTFSATQASADAPNIFMKQVRMNLGHPLSVLRAPETSRSKHFADPRR